MLAKLCIMDYCFEYEICLWNGISSLHVTWPTIVLLAFRETAVKEIPFTDHLNLKNMFVCVEALRPSQPNGVMSSAVSLPNHTFSGQAWSSKRLTSIVHILSSETDNCPSWISGRLNNMTLECMQKHIKHKGKINGTWSQSSFAQMWMTLRRCMVNTVWCFV